MSGLLGECGSDNRVQQLFTASAEMRGTLRGWLAARQLSQLARVWVEGVEVDWSALHGDTPPSRIAAPLYPFARERYWLPPADDASAGSRITQSERRRVEPSEQRPGRNFQPLEAAASENADAALEHYLLVPGWRALERAPTAHDVTGAFPLAGEGILVVAQEHDWREIADRLTDAHHRLPDAHLEIGALRRQLQQVGAIRHLVWIASGRTASSVHDVQLVAQAEALIGGLFRWIKALLLEGYGERPLAWTVITCDGGAVFKGDAVNPAHAGVVGLAGSMAREHGEWSVRVADRQRGDPLPLEQIVALPRNTSGEMLAWREGRWWQPCLRPATDRGGRAPAMRQCGVYVVFGGAGGIGQAWSEAMVRRFDARLIWVGRRAPTAEVLDRIGQVARHGRAPQYMQADLGDDAALARVRDQVRQR